MRVHTVGLPHVDTTRAHCWCAYGQKLRRWPLILQHTQHETVLYASANVDDDTAAACAEYVPIVGAEERQRWFGGPWDESQVFGRWDPADPMWVEHNALAIAAISERIQPDDAIAIVAGRCQQMFTNAFPSHITLEPFVGYEGILPNSHHVFESNAWRSYCAAKQPTDDLHWFDAVIPNSWCPDEFDPPRQHDGYLLFIGRATERKGLAVVRELAQRFPVKCAGQADPQIPGAEYVGIVKGDEKAKLFAAAAAVLAPTTYLEPFGGVAVEAQLSGVPALTTDYGAFPETCPSEWRCSTLAEFVAAVEGVMVLDLYDRRDIAERARARWTVEAVAPLYDRWLTRVASLYADGWYQQAS